MYEYIDVYKHTHTYLHTYTHTHTHTHMYNVSYMSGESGGQVSSTTDVNDLVSIILDAIELNAATATTVAVPPRGRAS